ncbi:PREDICTED: uncharacterized protein LOC104733968 [Camelina sativa]|uniref:Uncharacterized protein LOC104733968 n=1 Tax=Camelina sativa TaxID=90675 RepID=A0ABM0V6T0_CAMSA|nr:PREDICTED: uncharacterized protein LOC104733968 [Camelina sativa]
MGTFKDYERDYPHHGFAQGNLLSTFYRGLHPKYQLSLDTVSNGDFTTKTIQEGRALIDNLSASSSNTCTDFDRSIRSSNSNAKEIADLKNMMNQLLRNRQHGVNACETINNGNMEPFQEDSYDQEEEVNYVRNYPQQANRFQGKNFGGNNNNFQLRAQFNNNKPPFQTGPAQAPTSKVDANVDIKMQEILVSFQKQLGDINSRMDNIYTELKGKFESISIHVKKLETQVAQTANTVPRQVGVLPAKPEENPKEYCNAISVELASLTVKPSLWHSLCDSGANINVMSRSVAEKLGLREISPSNLSLVFGDSSQKVPDGLVRDLQLVVGDCIVPTDFQILEMEEKNERPLILERPFLATVGAIIDHKSKRTIFANINKKKSYPTISKPKPWLTNSLHEEPMNPSIDKMKQFDHSASTSTNNLLPKPPKPPKPPQISKIKIIVPPELSSESKEQIQKMIRHTKEVLLHAKFLKLPQKDNLLLKLEQIIKISKEPKEH